MGRAMRRRDILCGWGGYQGELGGLMRVIGGIGGMEGVEEQGRNDVILMSKQSSDVTRVGFDLDGG